MRVREREDLKTEKKKEEEEEEEEEEERGSIDLDSKFSSVTQSCPTLCDPMNHSTPGFPIHHRLPESTQTHVH